MEIFGWVVLISFAVLGVTLGVFMVLPYIITTIDSVKYKRNKLAEISKLDTEERLANQKVRKAKIREKEELIAEKKAQLKILKLNKKIMAQQEALIVAQAEAKMQKEVAEGKKQVSNEIEAKPAPKKIKEEKTIIENIKAQEE